MASAEVAVDIGPIVRKPIRDWTVAERGAGFAATNPFAYRCAFAILKTVTDAEDAVHNGWVKILLYQSWRGGSVEQFLAFLGTTVRRAAFDIERKRWHGPPLDDLEGPEQLAETRDPWLLEIVARCLALLSAAHRSVLIAVFFDGKSLVELRTELGLPAATVRQRKRRALEQLRNCLKRRLGRQFGDFEA